MQQDLPIHKDMGAARPRDSRARKDLRGPIQDAELGRRSHFDQAPASRPHGERQAGAMEPVGGRQEKLPGQKHCVEEPGIMTYKKVYAWVLEDRAAYDPPRPYRPKKGGGCLEKAGLKI